MTDLETLLDMFKRAGGGDEDLEVERTEKGSLLHLREGFPLEHAGYSGFYTTFTFGEAGNLIGVGVWE